MVAAYAVLISLMYRSALQALWQVWQIDEYNYCFFVPLVVWYLLWEKRAEFAAAPCTCSGLGFPLLVVSLVFFWLGEVTSDNYLQFLSLWGVVVSLCFLHLGMARVRVYLFEFGFALAAFPPPALIYEPLTANVKLISTKLGVDLLHVCGNSAFREGNVIDLGFGKLQVVDACSGLRYLVPLVILSLLLGHLSRVNWFRRGVLILSAVPLAVLGNSLRLAVTGILYGHIGERATEGFLHEFIGWLIFAASFGLLALEMQLLKKGSQEGGTPPVAPPPSTDNPLRFGRGGVAGALLLAASVALSLTVHFDREVPPLRPFAQFPKLVGTWTGTGSTLEKKFLDVLNLTDYLIMDYRDPSGRDVNLYVAYKGNKEKGGFLHSPGTCMPGNGWNFRESGEETLSGIPGVPGMRVNRAFMEKDGQRQLSYYWFPKHGRILTTFLQIKLYGILDALVDRRTDAALVRLITPIAQGEEVADAERRLQGFTRTFAPVLEGFIPGR